MSLKKFAERNWKEKKTTVHGQGHKQKSLHVQTHLLHLAQKVTVTHHGVQNSSIVGHWDRWPFMRDL